MIKDLKQAECLELLANNYLGHLGFIAGRSPHVTPITYFFDAEERCIISYSANGHKIDAMRSYEFVSLQVEEVTSIQEWKSVLIHCTFAEEAGSTAKKYLHKFTTGVRDIIERKTGEKPKFIEDFSSKLKGRELPVVYRLHIKDISGKFRCTEGKK
ncbi:pyridoxamine 5'-phosphate oxidase family protein [Maribacter chungangensis]|uniref:Pyridoxamine 5'-phosphate oxidase family protein n=1 Tax=Maribacter chungangensis TaxID=1069117 RepID=A0ABW3B205_9FLAO